MANKKVPRRDEYDEQLQAIADDLPKNYAVIVQHYRPDLDRQRIYHARKGKVVDFEILNEFKRVVREAKASKQTTNS